MAPDEGSYPGEEDGEKRGGEEYLKKSSSRPLSHLSASWKLHHHSLGPDRVPAALTISPVCLQISTHSSSLFARMSLCFDKMLSFNTRSVGGLQAP